MFTPYTTEELETLDMTGFLRRASQAMFDILVASGVDPAQLEMMETLEMAMGGLLKGLAYDRPQSAITIVDRLRTLEILNQRETSDHNEQASVIREITEELDQLMQELPNSDKELLTSVFALLLPVLLSDPAATIVVLNKDLAARKSKNNPTMHMDWLLQMFASFVPANKVAEMAVEGAAITHILSSIPSSDFKTPEARNAEHRRAVEEVHVLLNKIVEKIPSEKKDAPVVIVLKDSVLQIAQQLVHHFESLEKSVAEASSPDIAATRTSTNEGAEKSKASKVGLLKKIADNFGWKPKGKVAEPIAEEATLDPGMAPATQGQGQKPVLHQAHGARAAIAPTAHAESGPTTPVLKVTKK
ncbi:MAG: hypothetical protein V4490_05660 [Pseudomonadota bacterium]